MLKYYVKLKAKIWLIWSITSIISYKFEWIKYLKNSSITSIQITQNKIFNK